MSVCVPLDSLINTSVHTHCKSQSHLKKIFPEKLKECQAKIVIPQVLKKLIWSGGSVSTWYTADSSVHTVTVLQAGQQGNWGLIASRSNRIYSSPVSSLAWGSYRGWGGQGMKLTTELCLVPRLRISGDTTSVPHTPSCNAQVQNYFYLSDHQHCHFWVLHTECVRQQNMLSSHRHLFTLTQSHYTYHYEYAPFTHARTHIHTHISVKTVHLL